ncbi:hypothetical protein A2V47_03710 [Candidatus Atribacteria bacterium RBG_19FT_COMBO_35_14]|uniref:Uncharacterized protein n=1 Tax=Candidatus Sediminicultor quintus TaxID=1797291 RepID=A0A1F5A5T4_9BACT|nr:MAG: hypothetical protein A2V47_03710 [Candidatus Atribacteria bacterium RBG_19FT_COMBO_35_14]
MFFIFILLIQKIFRNVNRANAIFQIKIKKYFYHGNFLHFVERDTEALRKFLLVYFANAIGMKYWHEVDDNIVLEERKICKNWRWVDNRGFPQPFVEYKKGNI